ncbi:glycosyltransferase [Klebsiella quasipneumoniae]|nr:glycosyltransferase [Klebsiella quasipneumoniae]EKV4330792.1 glycosyltransferase [Klebsiella quasipneumoniae]
MSMNTIEYHITYSDLKPFLGNNPLFIFPTNTYGGHEVMTIGIIESLLVSGCNVTVAIEPTNISLKKKISQYDTLNNFTLPIKQGRFEFLHALLNVYKVFMAKDFLKKIRRDGYSSIIIVQGDIELGSIYVNAAYALNLPFISYIPYAHSAKKMGKKLSLLRDLYYPFVYRRIKQYLTISDVFKDEIKAFSPSSDVYVLKNQVRDVSSFRDRRKLHYSVDYKEFYHIAVIGRVNFKQKGHDILLEAINLLSNELREYIIVDIVGTGPDLKSLRSLVSSSALEKHFIFHGWQTEPWEHVYLDDALIIPSRFEGVPLVMLEGISIGIDILASNADGMRDYLPNTVLFNNSKELSILLEKKIKQKFLKFQIASRENNYE